MRRTLVSRKARKKRIAENAEMNGDNYYANRAATAAVTTEDYSLAKAESPPPTSAGPLVDKSPSTFATYDVTKEGRPSVSTDDRVPLNPRNPSIRSTPSERERIARQGNEQGMPPPRMGPGPGPGAGRGYPRDQYGNQIGPGMMRGDAPGSRGGMGPMFNGRGRGGPPPGPMRGGYGPPRGGYGGPGRGGFGPGPMMRGGPQGMRPPPQQGPYGPGPGRGGMGGMGPMMAGAAGGMAAGAMMGRGRGQPPPGYDNGPYGGARGLSPERDFARDSSPPPALPEEQGLPVGQAIEMDARTGSPARSPVKPDFGIRDSDSDLNGMVALQGGQRARMNNSPLRPHDGLNSPTSQYSDPHESFVPARAAWNRPPPANMSNSSSNALTSSNTLPPIEGSPVELPVGQFRSTPSPAVGSAPRKVRSFSRPRSPSEASPEPTQPLPSRTPPPASATPHSSGHTRSGSESYYEDVDPRFAEDPMPHESAIPTALQAGFNRSSPVNDRSLLPSQSGPAPTGRLPTPPSRPGTAPNNPNTSDSSLPRSRSRQESSGNNQYPQATSTPPIASDPPSNTFLQNDVIANNRFAGLGAISGVSTPQQRGLGPMAIHADPSTSNATTTSGSLGLTSNGLRSSDHTSPNSTNPNRKPSPPALPIDDINNPYEDPSFETIPSGSRSPGEESDISHFTSISQRGVNPNWRPPPGSMPSYDGAGYGGPSPIPGQMPPGGGYPGAMRPQRRQEDLLLAGAPDFSVPGVGPPGRGGRGGMRGGGMVGGVGGMGGRGGLQGMARDGRYPSEM
ncbi:MAG: regulator of ime2 [Bogoriella megaspora]|nr:MAG: regulator of ime2 [Bogoriella megaspora]